MRVQEVVKCGKVRIFEVEWLEWGQVSWMRSEARLRGKTKKRFTRWCQKC